jgi:hypothetical protein
MQTAAMSPTVEVPTRADLDALFGALKAADAGIREAV